MHFFRLKEELNQPAELNQPGSMDGAIRDCENFVVCQRKVLSPQPLETEGEQPAAQQVQIRETGATQLQEWTITRIRFPIF